MARVLLLIPSESYRAPDFMEAAGRLGVEVVVGTDRRNPLQGESGGRLVELDFDQPDVGATQVEAFATLHPLDTIVAVDDGGQLIAARAARRLELPYNSVGSVEATRNKARLRELIAAAGLPSPEAHVLPLNADPREAARAVTYPVVLKPLALSASQGVLRADNETEFLAAVARIRAILQTPEAQEQCGAPLADRLLIEGYVPGIEVSVEGLLDGGRLRTLAIFDKPDPLVGPTFEETIYVTPSRLPDADQQSLIATTEAACRALGLETGPVHAELRLHEGRWYPIDIAARSIGGLCARTLSFGTGMSLEEILLRHATGLDVPSYEREAAATGVMMIPIPRAGVLRAVRGVAEAEAVPLIESVTISIRTGGLVVPLPEGTEYLGFIFAKGGTPAEVEQALRDAHAQLDFEIEAVE
ncbi:MAG: ATP-grasp domain-containing protein [Chloroflexi bacterium]|nr:ATP-grasp domain-containing protein [Chloroflexota bacterium]MDA1239971.1 ATP-grasp domain-containing protein [Chloroflexota bacterium]